MPNTSRSTWIPAVLVFASLAANVALSAQSAKFQAEMNRLNAEFAAAAKAKGLKFDEGLSATYPAPELRPVKVQKVTPGGSIAVTISGKFPAGAGVLSQRDGAVLSGGAMTAASYSARLTVGASEPPGFVQLYAYAPISFAVSNVPVAFIDTVYSGEFTAANGWTVKLTPKDKSFTIVGDRNASLTYQVDFFKPGETKPAETRIGTQNFSQSDAPASRLNINLTEAKASAQAEFEELSKKLGDPKLTDAQREALGERMAQAQTRMMEEMVRGASDPAAAQKKVDDFGCRLLQVYPGEGTAVTGNFLCGKNFSGGMLATKGTLTVVR
jgi:hypothetical protein